MFSGNPFELSSLKFHLRQFLGANYDTYTDTKYQILYAGILLSEV